MLEELISDIEAYCARRKIAESTFGYMAVNDGKFVKRLRERGDCQVGTFERARAYMVANPPVEPEAA